MAYIILVTGGSRSGKSQYASQLAESLSGSRAFVATCPVIDQEMRARVDRHIQERAQANWYTIEELTELTEALRRAQAFSIVVLDCLTLWVNNLMYYSEKSASQISEEDITRKCLELLKVSNEHKGTIIFVTNEVGMGIVPENPAARLFRDLVGRCNQTMAEGANEVTLLACGLPIQLKKRKTE